MILETMCDNLKPFMGIVKNGIMPIIQFGVPILLITLGTIDLVKAVVSGDNKKSSEATSSLIRRAAYGVIVFFVPVIINLVFGMFKETDDAELEQIDFFQCWNSIK